MKYFLSVFTVGILSVVLSVSVFAAPSYHDYVPEIPSFFSVTQGNVKINVPIHFNDDKDKKAYDTFLSDGKPYLIFLEQHKYNPAKEDSGESYNKGFVVTIVKPRIQNSQSSIGTFLYEGGTNGDGGNTKTDTYINPMRYVPNVTKIGGYDFIQLIYDEKEKACYSSTIGASTYPIRFTYVLASSPTYTHGTPEEYPYFNAVGGKEHTFVSQVVSPWTDRHYNWWLGVNGEIKNPDGEDTDGDGKPDINIDTDGDGKPDVNIDTDGDKKPDLNIDTDKDGKPDLNVDTDDDGKPDLNVDTDKDGKPDLNVDTDKDGKPDLNVDTDKDGKPDLNVDTDKDGKPDLNVDTDKNGKPDLNVDTNKDGNPDLNIDTDKDGKPNINIDTNGDGKPDINIDTSGNGKPDINIDTSGNGKPDINIDTNGDGKPDINIDTNGDGKPNVNVDTNGDGKPDTNVSPDGGSSGGGDGSGETGNGGSPDDWFPSEDDDGIYNGFPIFDPFDPQYEDVPSHDSNNPYDNYNPLDGYQIDNMPDVDLTPNFGDYQFSNPFVNPYPTKP